MNEESRPRLLVPWEGENLLARQRESRLAALVLHLALIIMIVISPRMFAGGALSAAELQVVQPDVTVLYLPNDITPIPEPKTPPDLTLEERRRAIVHPPLTINPDELRRALTPPTPPGPQMVPLTPPQLTPPGAGSPPPGPGQDLQARAAEQPPGAEGGTGLSRDQIARLEDVPPINRNASPALTLPQASPGRSIEESLRRSQAGAGKGGTLPGEGDLGGPIQPDFNTPFPTILSDTRGVDFSPYLIRLLRKVRANWYATIPESARWGEKGRVVIIFTILKDGDVPAGQPTIVSTSGRSYLDRPALAAILGAKPFPPLPKEFDGPHIVLQFTFLYNLPIDYTGP
jgi:TonB family protein